MPILGAMSGAPGYQRLFAELKRRKVFKVAAVYGAVSFGVLEGSGLTGIDHGLGVLPAVAKLAWG